MRWRYLARGTSQGDVSPRQRNQTKKTRRLLSRGPTISSSDPKWRNETSTYSANPRASRAKNVAEGCCAPFAAPDPAQRTTPPHPSVVLRRQWLAGPGSSPTSHPTPTTHPVLRCWRKASATTTPKGPSAGMKTPVCIPSGKAMKQVEYTQVASWGTIVACAMVCTRFG